jgi:hypothetical protein
VAALAVLKILHDIGWCLRVEVDDAAAYSHRSNQPHSSLPSL